MPRVPKWVADAMENVFSSQVRKVVVSEIIYLNPFLKKVTFKGDFSNVKFKLGQAISIRVNETNFRNYTPSNWDSQEGVFQVIFHIHGNGPGSNFISDLQLNDSVNIILPRGFELYRKEHKYHFFFGDETTIGLFESLQHSIEENGQEYIGILELNQETLRVEFNTKSGLEIVPSSIEKARNAISILERLPDVVWKLWQNGAFYLMGNGRSIQNFRTALKEKGVNLKNIKTQPYWVEGKVGL
jgi:NADPH-dependent ferric siderophore reductase